MNLKRFMFNPFAENTYIIDNGHNAVIIDCGCSNDNEAQQLLNYIQEQQLEPIALLNTHFHLDHQFGNETLFQKYGLVPYGSERDLPLMKSYEQQCDWFGITDIPASTNKSFNNVSDGDVLKFDDLEFQVISTPGHTPGCVCYLLKTEDNKPDILFSGDTIFKNGIGRTDLPYGNWSDMQDSIKKILTLPDDTIIFSGHGEVTTIAAERLWHVGQVI